MTEAKKMPVKADIPSSDVRSSRRAVAKSMSLREAHSIAGSIGFPSKMPGTSYGLPAQACLLGSKLAKIPGTICSGCYALRGGAFYQMPRAVKGQQRRLAGITHPKWTEAMVTLLTHYHSKSAIKVDLGLAGIRLQRSDGSRYRFNPTGFHRWHDSGDLQSLEHFIAIVNVATQTPTIQHWLPTQELGIVMQALESGLSVPGNLLIRVSDIKVNAKIRRGWLHTSGVHERNRTFTVAGWICPAPTQGHECKTCRACWDRKVPHVSYEKH